MASKKNQAPAATETENDLLDDVTGTENTGTDNAAGTEGTEEVAKIEFNGKMYTPEELDAEIKRLQGEVKNLKAAKKGEKAAPTRTLKGQMVAFRNKAGQLITGLGVQYYVARHGGKLHYKEASQVVILPENWKDGDPIPELPSKEAVAPEAENVAE